jgi:ubiquitin C-terminal hydrolase
MGKKKRNINRVSPAKKKVEYPTSTLQNNNKSSAHSNVGGVKGLLNVGNTCFFNSILQALNVAVRSMNFDDTSHGKVFDAFITTMRAMSSSSSKSSINPSILLSAISSKAHQFKGRQQQDAQELFVWLISSLIEEFKSSSAQDNTTTIPAHNPIATSFIGKECSILRCRECNHKSFTLNDFTDISLEIPGSASLMEAPIKYQPKSKASNNTSKSTSLAKERDNKLISDNKDDTVMIQSVVIEASVDGTAHIDTVREPFNEDISLTPNSTHSTSTDKHIADRAICVISNECGNAKMNDQSHADGTECPTDVPSGVEAQVSECTDALLSKLSIETYSKVEDSNNDAQLNEIEKYAISGGSTVALKDCTREDCGDRVIQDVLEPASDVIVNKSDVITLIDCLNDYTASEVITDISGNGYACPICCRDGEKRDSIKRLLFLHIPNVLAIHFKRLLPRGKCTSKISFPLDLNLGNYLGMPIWKNDLISDTNDGVDCNYHGSSIYELFAVVEHQGTARGGHYISYVKHCSNNDSNNENSISGTNEVWFYTSDILVRKCTVEEVLRCQAYMLFYRKKSLYQESDCNEHSIINSDTEHGNDNHK